MDTRKICLLQQECGIGDIIFCQGVANHYRELGYRIVWPIKKEIFEIVPYLNDQVEFYPTDEDYPLKSMFLECYSSKKLLKSVDEHIFIPLGYSSYMIHPINRQIMQSKYTICGLDWKIWKDNFNITRNCKKENELFYDILGLKDDEDFTFLNETFSTQPTVVHRDIKSLLSSFEETKICKMRFVDGFTLFDWCKVFENMKYTLTVDTSLMYILEKLNLRNKENFICVPRSPITESDVGNMFEIPWRFINV